MMISSAGIHSFQDLNKIISTIEQDVRVPVEVLATVVYNQRVTSLEGKPYDIILIQSDNQTRLVRSFTNVSVIPGIQYRMMLTLIKGPYDVSLFLDSCLEVQGKKTITQIKSLSQVTSEQDLRGLVISETLLIKDIRDQQKARVFILQEPQNPKCTYYLNLWRDSTTPLLESPVDSLMGSSVRVQRVLSYKKRDSMNVTLKLIRNISKVSLTKY